MNIQYSQKAQDRFQNPRNLGVLENPDGHAERTGLCGEIMVIWIQVRQGCISKATFVTDGCGASLATGSIVTELAEQEKVEDAIRIQQKDILDALGGMSEASEHCALLAADTLHAAIEDYHIRCKEND